MFSKKWLINFVLTMGVIFFGLKAYEVWSEGKKWPLEMGPIKNPLPWPEKKIIKRSMPSEAEYEVIVSSNLFRDDRSEPQPREPEKKPERKPEVGGRDYKILERAAELTNLYGVVIVGEHRKALIGEIPAGKRTSGGEKGVKQTKVGDMVGRFKVKEIRETDVLLSAGGHEWRISLFDIDKPKKRGRAKKKTGPVVVGVESKPKTLVAKGSDKGKERLPEPEALKRKTLPKAQEKKRNPSALERPRPERR